MEQPEHHATLLRHGPLHQVGPQLSAFLGAIAAAFPWAPGNFPERWPSAQELDQLLDAVFALVHAKHVRYLRLRQPPRPAGCRRGDGRQGRGRRVCGGGGEVR